MRVIIEADYQSLSQWAANYVVSKINKANPTAEKPFVLGLPTGSSPLGMYKALIQAYKDGKVSFKNVVTFNMDEYVGLPESHPESYHSFMFNNFFNHIDIDKNNIHILNGNAEDLYNAGIRASFQQHGVKGVESYLASTKTPAKYPGFRSSPSAPAPSNITVAWSEDSEVEQLEQIITQKWIAMYPLGQEAWSEFRRTGYPKLYEIVNNESGGVISSSMQIRRVPFPNSEYQGNKEEVEKAITLLGGPDNGATRLWWDVENK